jgi:hypothetical protein
MLMKNKETVALFGVIFFGFVFLSCQVNRNTDNEGGLSVNNSTDTSKRVLDDSSYIYGKFVDEKCNGLCSIVNRRTGNLTAQGIMVNGFKTGAWKYFNERGELYQVGQFYDDSLLFYLDKTDFELIERLVYSSGKVKVNIPKSWETMEKGKLFSAFKTGVDDFRPSLTMVQESLPEGGLDSFVKTSINELKRKYNDFDTVYNESILINQIKAIRIAYRFNANSNNIGAITTFYDAGSKVYILTGVASNQSSGFLKYKSLFEEISATFSTVNH